MAEITEDLPLEILRDMIALPSENPPGDESKIGAYAADLLRGWGLDVSIVASEPNRPNVIARAYGGPGGKRLILQSHLDTKPANASPGTEQWATDPFTPTEIEGRIYGLGAVDTKSGAAAQLAAIYGFLRTTNSWSGEIIWQGVADEENGSLKGAAYLLEQELLKADAALVAEPTDLTISTAQLGNAWAEIHVHGRFAHAGTPWEGINAVNAAIEFIGLVREALTKRTPDERFPGHPILNIGRIEGGYHPGTVPNYCQLRIDIRVRPGETREEYYDLLRRCARECESQTGGRIEIVPYTFGGCHPHEVSATLPWVLNLVTAWKEVERTDARVGGFFGGSDAFFFEKAGTPAVVFGPGRLEQAHSINEYVLVEDTPRAARMLKSALGHFLSQEDIA